ncbi:major facilitator superfamily MFS_1 [Beutenbergia cavernae DSM 12333]|uniref:Major facilitator superfamily MFS_1 n=1 Tax=Beutenbergia cavernae (strain ATCC BAA-8 / DSM 12333 / CCUG 43141 / JCM 11478 / NBRC 16432 / NCIMB 13614 / HKI 0122) TaxID=471853 RepID=C5BXT2_BEUC1|nr:MFS transporter [Beutenbergia cavernae]ACQ78826.1 major facilitator superfamily MFS_1 [Beutenbergia cavernae DSM 12333]
MPDPTELVADWREAPDVRAVQHRTRRVLVSAQVLGSVGMGASASVGILLAEQVTQSETWAGVARTSTTLGAALVSLPLALLAARAGRRTALSAGWSVALLGAVLLVLAAATSSTVLLVLGMLAFGAGSATGLQSRFAATDLEVPAHRARTLSIVVWAMTIGSVLGPNLGAPGELVESWFGLPELSGAFVISAAGLTATVIILLVFLRPDPVAVAAAKAGPDAVPAPKARGSLVLGLRAIVATAPARFAFVALVLAHTSMVLLMTMTPVHMHHHGGTVEIIGLVISGHVLGMFAFSPLVGALADRIGRIATILIGQAVLLAAAVAAIGWSGGTGGVTVALFLLGLGWSFVTIPAATVVSDAVAPAVRNVVQGTSDTAMNVVAAVAAGVSGPLLAVVGFANLAWGVVALVIPVAVLALPLRRGVDRAA